MPPLRRKLGARKLLLFAGLAAGLSVAVMMGALLALDLYFHRRFDAYASLNRRGYRGPVVGRKRAGERRVVMLGGSTVYGDSVYPNETIAASLERRLPGSGAPATTVVNLGMSGNGAHTFRFTLEDFAPLEPDAAILYEGYNDLGAVRNIGNTRRDSPVFRLTGYYPILPLVLREKALVLRYGDIAAAYRGEKTVFRPVHGQGAAALEAAAAMSASLERQLGRVSPDTSRDRPTMAAPCPERWAYYCGAVSDAIRYALDRGVRVLVVTQPYLSDQHVEQQRALEAMLLQLYPGDSRVRYLNLGRVVDLHDRSVVFDGMHLTAEGNDRIASELVRPVRDLLAR